MSLIESFITAINDEIKAIEKKGATKNVVLKNGEFVEKTQQIVLKILVKIKSDFSIIIPRKKVSSKIADKDWKRFCNIFFGKNN